jgi:hypothetical protein
VGHRAPPWLTAAYACGYLTLGAVYSVFKWFLAERANVRVAKVEFARYAKVGDTWADYVKTHKTVVSHYTSDLVVWVTFWPFSAAWMLLHDPFARIVAELRGVYQRITDYVWA